LQHGSINQPHRSSSIANHGLRSQLSRHCIATLCSCLSPPSLLFRSNRVAHKLFKSRLPCSSSTHDFHSNFLFNCFIPFSISLSRYSFSCCDSFCSQLPFSYSSGLNSRLPSVLTLTFLPQPRCRPITHPYSLVYYPYSTFLYTFPCCFNCLVSRQAKRLVISYRPSL